MAALLTFPRPEVNGAFADYLSWQDMLEIAALPYGHSEIRRPVYGIYMTARDRAEVGSGRRPKNPGDKFTTFWAHRASGHWYIVKGSVSDEEMVIVTGLTRSMKPTAPLRENFSVFVTTPCRGLSLS